MININFIETPAETLTPNITVTTHAEFGVKNGKTGKLTGKHSYNACRV